MVRDIFRLALRSLLRHRVRAVLTTLGIIIGTAAVITVCAIGAGGKREISSAFRSFGLNSAILSETSGKNFTEADLSLIERMSPEVSSAMPLLYQSVSVSATGSRFSAGSLGVGASFLSLSRSGALYGRGLTTADLAARTKVCMLDKGTAEKLFHRADAVSKKIILQIGAKEEEYTVIGILDPDSIGLSAIFGTYLSDLVYLPYTSLMDFAGISSFPGILISFSDFADAAATGRKASRLLSADASGKQVRCDDLAGQQKTVDFALQTLTLILSAVAAISLIVSGIGVMTVMLVAVSERRREIGMKKALGATKGHILAEFMAEALLLCLAGGGVGIAAGWLCSQGAGLFLKITPEFRVDICIYSLLFCAIIGIIFSVYPARKAAALTPIECLK